MRGISGPCALILAAVAMQLFGFSSFAEAQAPAPAPADAKSVDLKEAQGRLAKASSPADYAAMLDSFAAALKPSEALVLLDQGIAQAEGADRKKLLVRAADLDLLVGLFGEAASRYEAAAGGDPVLLLRAARCEVAAGDPEKASSLAADVVAAAQDSELAAAARLVGAWSLAMQGNRTDAASVASAIALAPKDGALALSAERRREARFLLWLWADGGGKAAASSTLSAEFPGSPEALIAAGSVSAPPLPHWYLGDLGNFGAAAAGKQPLAAATASAPFFCPSYQPPAPRFPLAAA